MNFEKTQELVGLSFQKKGTKLPLQKFNVKLLVDKSGSMQEEFQNGWVSKTIDLFTACASKFDDDGKLIMGFFNDSYTQGVDASETTFGNYLHHFPQTPESTTNYSQAIQGILNQSLKSKLFSLFSTKVKKPNTYLAMITDGDCADYTQFLQTVGTFSFDRSIFFQVIAIGDQVTTDKLVFLKKYPNCDFIHIEDPHSIDEEKFLEVLLHDKFVNWTHLN